MCLIVFAWHAHPEYPLVVAANRDEFYARRTRPAAWWGQAVSVLAGRDDAPRLPRFSVPISGSWRPVRKRRPADRCS